MPPPLDDRRPERTRAPTPSTSPTERGPPGRRKYRRICAHHPVDHPTLGPRRGAARRGAAGRNSHQRTPTARRSPPYRGGSQCCDLWVMSDVDRVSPVPPRPPSTGPDQRKPARRYRPVSPAPTPRAHDPFTDPLPPLVIVKAPPALKLHMRPPLRETRLLSFVGPRDTDRESRHGCTSTGGAGAVDRPPAGGHWRLVSGL